MTDKPNWTPGPWDWDCRPEKIGFNAALVGRAGAKVLDTASYENMWFAQYGDNGINAANAHLIAAAPDLYEALDGLLNEPTNAPDYLPSRFWDAARAALAKARGQA